MLIVSADKDLMQLIEPGVAMFDPASGDREERRIGEQEVFDYFGAAPNRVIDIQALAGDSTDNVPGAPGIGVKTAAQLIAEYGDLDSLLVRAGEIKQPKRRETLTNPDSVALIRVSKQLVTLVRDVALDVPLRRLALEAASRSSQDRKRLIGFLKAMEFTTNTKRLGEICALDTATIDADPAFVGPGGWRGRNGGAAPTPPAATPVAGPAHTVAAPAAGDPTAAPSLKRSGRPCRSARGGSQGEADRRRGLRDGARRRAARGMGGARARDRAGRFRHRDGFARSVAGRAGRRFARAHARRGLLHSDRAPRGRRRPQFGGGDPAAWADRRGRRHPHSEADA